jgi:hypothetical protein
MMAEDTPQFEKAASDLRRKARYMLSIACLVKDATKHDELQQKAQKLLAEAEKLRGPTV